MLVVFFWGFCLLYRSTNKHNLCLISRVGTNTGIKWIKTKRQVTQLRVAVGPTTRYKSWGTQIFLKTFIEFQGQAHHLGTNGPVMLTGGHGVIYLERKAPDSGSVMTVEVRYAVGSLPWAWWQKVAGTSTDPPLCVYPISTLVTAPQYESKHWLTSCVQVVLESPVKNLWLWKEDQIVWLAVVSELEEMP